MSKFVIFAILFFGGCLFRGRYALTISLANLTNDQRNVLNEFRSNMEQELPHDYMKNDELYLRFLSMNDFSLPEATSNLRQHLEWRRSENVDNVLKEDWSDMEQKFPYELSGRTRNGNPILYIPMGKYNFRSEVESGNAGRLKRYMGIKIQEDAAQLMRSLRKSGENEILQYEVIYDMDGYSFYNLGCIECMLLERELIQQTKTHYPRARDNMFILNTPPFFENTFPFLAEAFSWGYTHVLGNRESYMPTLLKYTEKEQLPKKLREEL